MGPDGIGVQAAGHRCVDDLVVQAAILSQTPTTLVDGIVYCLRRQADSERSQRLSEAGSERNSAAAIGGLTPAPSAAYQPSHLRFMPLRRRNEPDTVMLSGDPLDRAQQALDIAREQIRRGQQETADYQAEDALVEAEDAIDTARARTADAAAAEREAAEESGAADRQRLAARPIYRPR
jgi:hypothetical protein